jgi:hypothetical protein
MRSRRGNAVRPTIFHCPRRWPVLASLPRRRRIAAINNNREPAVSADFHKFINWRIRMPLKLTIASAVLMFSLIPGIASAQINEEFSNLQPYIDEARTTMARDRKVLIREALGLTSEEEKTFWTAYREYEQDRDEVNKIRLKVITDFAANQDNFTDDIAKDMLKDFFKFEKEQAKVKEKHASKFKKTIPEAKVARFYQLENKLDAIINFALAMQIPLIEPK